jgi:hypothetical protein
VSVISYFYHVYIKGKKRFRIKHYELTENGSLFPNKYAGKFPPYEQAPDTIKSEHDIQNEAM